MPYGLWCIWQLTWSFSGARICTIRADDDRGQIQTLTPSIGISGGVCGGVIISVGSLVVFHRLKNGDEYSALMEFIREITAKAGCSSAPTMG